MARPDSDLQPTSAGDCVRETRPHSACAAVGGPDHQHLGLHHFQRPPAAMACTADPFEFGLAGSAACRAALAFDVLHHFGQDSLSAVVRPLPTPRRQHAFPGPTNGWPAIPRHSPAARRTSFKHRPSWRAFISSKRLRSADTDKFARLSVRLPHRAATTVHEKSVAVLQYGGLSLLSRPAGACACNLSPYTMRKLFCSPRLPPGPPLRRAQNRRRPPCVRQ